MSVYSYLKLYFYNLNRMESLNGELRDIDVEGDDPCQSFGDDARREFDGDGRKHVTACDKLWYFSVWFQFLERSDNLNVALHLMLVL